MGTFIGVVWVALWKGNEFIQARIEKKFSWEKNSGKRLIWGIAGMIIFTVATIIILFLSFERITGILATAEISRTIIFALFISFAVIAFLQGRKIQMEWHRMAVNQEKLKRESLSSRYEALKNQVNPHFLFNSLNVLTGLVYKDPDLAARFIKQLSRVYRYVLDTREEEVVNLENELDFLESYFFLQKMRFNNNLIIKINVDKAEDLQIPPLALQMLVENAIKHNKISDDKKLTISIYTDGEYLNIENNLQKKEIIQKSSGIGLANIESRYEFLTGKKVIIEDQDNRFIVKLPVLEVPMKN